MLAVAGAGTAYQLLAAVLTWRWFAGGASPAVPAPLPALTLLKPLHGAEPRLAANLATFLTQDYRGVVQMVCGVKAADDAALDAVAAVRAAYPDADIAIVVDAARHGANAKVSNLVNMLPAAAHDILVLSDSDMAVPPAYLRRVAAELAQPGVGAVTCLYHGRGDAGLWSKLAAMAIGHGFMPAGVVGIATGMATPCMGSTIALTRDTLDRIGGFAAFKDVLADDYAIGQAIRGLGLRIAIPQFTIAHACADASLAALVAHELRWNTTIRRLAPSGYAISGWLNPIPLALLGLACAPTASALWSLAAALAARIGVVLTVDRITHAPPGLPWLLPVRDTLSFGLFLASFLVQSVDWQGSRLRVRRDGTIDGNTA